MSLPVKLARRFHEQGGRCYWCGRETFLRGQLTTREAAERFGIEIGSKRWRSEARKREATAEHLIPQARGGTDCWANIVMACKGCNTERGDDTDWTAPKRQPKERDDADPLEGTGPACVGA